MLILFFGSAKLFSQSIRYILFFENSVNGLDAGSLAKYNGVPVGVVERILIRVEGQSKESTSIPVIVRIDRSRLTNKLGASVEVFEPAFIDEMISNGLAAELSIESYITGQLFVEFSLKPGQNDGFVEHRDGEYGMVEIPTLGSAIDEITENVDQVLNSFAKFDFYKTYKTINAVLENLQLALEGLKTEEVSQSIINLTDQVSRLLESEELEGLLASTHSTLEQLEQTAASYNLDEGPLVETVAKLNQTLDSVNELATEGNDLIAPESAIREELESALRELRQTTQALRLFINYLERNPNALLTGRHQETN